MKVTFYRITKLHRSISNALSWITSLVHPCYFCVRYIYKVIKQTILLRVGNIIIISIIFASYKTGIGSLNTTNKHKFLHHSVYDFLRAIKVFRNLLYHIVKAIKTAKTINRKSQTKKSVV